MKPRDPQTAVRAAERDHGCPVSGLSISRAGKAASYILIITIVQRNQDIAAQKPYPERIGGEPEG
jgi:hypothetical protein